jgi:hypothetical protein
MNHETEVALANLDWLIIHQGMRLDYPSRAVVTFDSEPAFCLEDLLIAGLTPATETMHANTAARATVPAAGTHTPAVAKPRNGDT